MSAAAFPAETAYGIRARLEYFHSSITAHRTAVAEPLRVLEIGCGTGALVTKPLARTLPDVSFVGFDIHTPSILEARAGAPSNVEFRDGALQAERDGHYDVIICSEVLEHLPDPGGMLSEIRRLLSERGIVLITIPNGYGPKELEDCLKRGVVKILPGLRRWLSSTNHTVASLNPVGHVQFFTMSRFRALVSGHGFQVVDYTGRRLLGGPISSRFLLTPRLRTWNIALGRKLPYWAVSSWMFTLHRK